MNGRKKPSPLPTTPPKPYDFIVYRGTASKMLVEWTSSVFSPHVFMCEYEDEKTLKHAPRNRVKTYFNQSVCRVSCVPRRMARGLMTFFVGTIDIDNRFLHASPGHLSLSRATQSILSTLSGPPRDSQFVGIVISFSICLAFFFLFALTVKRGT